MEPKPELEARVNELRRHRDELAENIRAAERELRGLRDGQDQEARELKAHLEKLHAKMGEVERELAELSRIQATGRGAGARPPQPQAPPEHVRQRRAELAEETRRIEERLRELRPEQEQEARELKAHLEKLHAKMAEIERESAERSRVPAAGRGAGARPPQPQAPAENVRQRRAELAEETRRIEERLRELRPEQEQEARELRARLDTLRDQMADIERRSQEPRRGPAPTERTRPAAEARPRTAPAEGRRLEAEVEDLRNQMRELREQMQQMQRLMEQVAARGQPREGAGERR